MNSSSSKLSRSHPSIWKRDDMDVMDVGITGCGTNGSDISCFATKSELNHDPAKQLRHADANTWMLKC